MPKKTSKPDNMAGKVVKLLHSLLDEDGQPHPYAGQEVTIVDRVKRAGPPSYVATTADQTEIDIKHDDFGPTDAEMLKVISGESATPLPDLGDDATAPALADQLATISLYLDPAKNFAQLIDLDLIDDSPSQPRTHYPESYIAGLTDSIRVVGIISPMLVRPKEGGRFENVFGHCRKRAARAAGFTQGPAFVRELTDAESAQLQAVENLQRKDLDPIDEAHSFAAYIKAHGCTKDEFCRRTGLSRTHVYNRLKLATLGKEGRDAMRAGKIKAEVATLIARVPNEKHQAQAVKMILDKTWNVEAPDEVMTTRKARDMLREKFTLALKGVLWALDDATLVESAGACTVCPKRSGVDPVLYEDLLGDKHSYGAAKGENVCTDPACFDTKKTAQLKANQAVLEGKGKTVIAGNKARQAIGADGQVKNGYIPLSEVREAIKKATVKGKPAPEVVVSVIQDPRSGKTVEVVKIDEAKAAGVKVTEPKKTGGYASYGSPAWKEQEAQREAKREKERKENERVSYSNIAVFLAVRAAAAKVARNVFDLKLTASMALDSVEHWDKGVLEIAYGVKSFSDIYDLADKMNADQLGQLILDCAMTGDIVTHGNDRKPELLLAAAKHYGVDVVAVRKQHADEKKAEAEAEAAAAKAAGEKPAATKAAKGKGKGKAAAPAEAEEEESEEVDA